MAEWQPPQNHSRVIYFYALEGPAVSFVDERKGSGFEFQIEHACDAIRAGKIEYEVVLLGASIAFQQLIEAERKR